MDRKAVFSILDGGLSKKSCWKTKKHVSSYPEAHYRENLKKLAYAFQNFQQIDSNS